MKTGDPVMRPRSLDRRTLLCHSKAGERVFYWAYYHGEDGSADKRQVLGYMTVDASTKGLTALASLV